MIKLIEKIQKDLCKKRNDKWIILSQRLRKIDEFLYFEILNETSFLNNDLPKLSHRIKYILENKKEVNVCNFCGNHILDISKKFCSTKCNNNSDETKSKFRESYNRLSIKDKQTRNEKRTKTFNERYGGYTLQSYELSKKVKKTMIDKYGSEHSFLNEKSKQKAINTWIKKYGVNNPFKSEDIKEKIKMVLLDRYGVDNSSKINPIERIEKIKKTKIENGWIIPDEFLSDYQKYRKKVKRLTEQTYKRYKDLINPNDLKRVSNGNYGYQLDHKYSIVEGFLNNVDPLIISNQNNLQMLEVSENRNKSRICSIDLDELKKLISYEI